MGTLPKLPCKSSILVIILWVIKLGCPSLIGESFLLAEIHLRLSGTLFARPRLYR